MPWFAIEVRKTEFYSGEVKADSQPEAEVPDWEDVEIESVLEMDCD